jgi:hypothetical protein
MNDEAQYVDPDDFNIDQSPSYLPKPEEVPEHIRDSFMTDQELDGTFKAMQSMLRTKAHGRKGVEPLVAVSLHSDLLQHMDPDKLSETIAQQTGMPLDEVQSAIESGSAFLRPQIHFTLDCESETKFASMYENGKQMGINKMQPICIMVATEIWMSKPDPDSGKVFNGMPRDNPDRIEGLSLCALMIDGRQRFSFTAVDRDPEGNMIVNQPWMGMNDQLGAKSGEEIKSRPYLLEHFYKGFMHGLGIRIGLLNEDGTRK